jgi:hypothetical protein
MLHVVVSSKFSHGILKRECVVRPPGRSKDATPDDATNRTLFCVLKDKILLCSIGKFFRCLRIQKQKRIQDCLREQHVQYNQKHSVGHC